VPFCDSVRREICSQGEVDSPANPALRRVSLAVIITRHFPAHFPQQHTKVSRNTQYRSSLSLSRHFHRNPPHIEEAYTRTVRHTVQRNPR